MRKLIAALMILAAGFVAGLSVKQLNVHADCPGDRWTTCRQGDTDGNGKLELTDAVRTLTFLFLNPDMIPVPIECPPQAPKGLPATGQWTCYDVAGIDIACGFAFPGQDGFYMAGCQGIEGIGRFVDNGDGTVTDTCTGLMWQKGTADVSRNGSIGNEDRLNWQGALKYCEGLKFAGHDDWRLPNVRELLSIVDYGHYAPAINPVFEAVSFWYWSSSSSVGLPNLAWYVYFSHGSVTGDLKGYDYFVRAVRGGL